MPESRPRKRFQIHLSTAIVLMFVAGALIWMNTRSVLVVGSGEIVQMEVETYLKGDYPAMEERWWGVVYHRYGWPFHMYQVTQPMLIRATPEILASTPRDPRKTVVIPQGYASHFLKDREREWKKIEIAKNAVVAIVLLFLFWYVREWRIRRYAMRKESC